MGVFFIAVAIAIIFSPYSSLRTFAQQVPPTAGETATSTPPTTSTTTAEQDTSTPVLSLVRIPDTTTDEVNLRLEWTTSRSDLTPSFIVVRQPSQEPWQLSDVLFNVSAGDTSLDLGTESQLWQGRQASDNVEYAVRFVTNGIAGSAGYVYSTSVTLSRPPAAEQDTSTPVLSLVRIPDTTTDEVNLRLEWTTSRSDLTPSFIVVRQPSQEPWQLSDVLFNVSAGDTSLDLGTESQLWQGRQASDNVEYAVRFVTNGIAGSAGYVYSTSVTLSRPSAAEPDTSTPPTTSTPAAELDTSTPVPSRPTSVSAGRHGGPLKSNIELRWDGNEGDETITGYRIWRGSEVLVENTETRTREFKDDFSQPSEAIYHVAAISPVGVSEKGSSLPATRESERMIPAPTSVTAAADRGFAGEEPSVTITWDAPVSEYFSPPLSESSPSAAISGYYIMRRKSGESYSIASVIAENTGSTALAYTDTTVELDVEYFYRVAARNFHGVGLVAESGGVTANSAVVWPAPQAPTRLGSERRSGFGDVASVRMFWSAPDPHAIRGYPADSGITHYQILRREATSPRANRGSYALFATTNTAAASLDIEGAYGDNYDYIVRAVNPTGTSPDSRTHLDIDFPMWPAPQAPTRLGSERRSGFGDVASVRMFWSAPDPHAIRGYPADSGITHYQILRREATSPRANRGAYALFATTNTAAASLDIEGAYGDNYDYIVRAVNPTGTSPDSRTHLDIDFPMWPAPQAPGNVSARQGSGGAIDVALSWSAPEPHTDVRGYPDDSGITGYRALRRLVGSGDEYGLLMETSDTSTTLQITLTREDQGVNYEYAVIAVNPTGAGPASSGVQYTLRLAPSAPRNLDEAIMLVWDADADPLLTGFQILRRVKDSGDDYSILVQNTGNANQYYVDASASYRVSYEYIVKAVNSVGVSPASNPITGMRMGATVARPEAPSNLTAEVVSGSVVLNWNAPNDSSVTGYKILRRNLNPVATPLAVLVSDTGGTTTTYTDTTTEPGYRYAYRVVALSPNGESKKSDFVNIRVR